MVAVKKKSVPLALRLHTAWRTVEVKPRVFAIMEGNANTLKLGGAPWRWLGFLRILSSIASRQNNVEDRQLPKRRTLPKSGVRAIVSAWFYWKWILGGRISWNPTMRIIHR